MTQRKKGKKPSRAAILEQMEKKRAQHREDVAGATDTLLGVHPDARPRNADYWRGHEDAHKELAAKRRASKDEKRGEEELANSRISVEFGDNTVTFRDGLDRIIKRDPLASWSQSLGNLMAERNCNNIGCRMGEHALFTVRGVCKTITARKAEAARQAGAGPGMDFQQRGGLGGREIS